ncbi:hypothetical protein Hanom_Chr16g01476501 [Helianthus anomalus]
MGGEVLPIISLSCLRAGGGRVSAHLGKPRGWRRSSSRPWPQRPVSRWLARRSLSFNKPHISQPTPFWITMQTAPPHHAITTASALKHHCFIFPITSTNRRIPT